MRSRKSGEALTLRKAGADVEGHLEGLLGVEAGVAVGVVARVEVGLQDGGAAAEALGDVIACHLQVDATWHCAQLLVHIEERLHLTQQQHLLLVRLSSDVLINHR